MALPAGRFLFVRMMIIWYDRLTFGDLVRSMPFDNVIIDMTRELLDSQQRVFPWMIACWSGVSISERTVRRYMARLAEEGKLIRLGSRCGYIVH